MTAEWHPLHPFSPPGGAAAGWRLTARAQRQGVRLLLHYRLQDPQGGQGAPQGLILDGAATGREEAGHQAGTRRRDDLWQHTCFEAFLAVPGEEAYWELNLAPGGDWNLYRLTSYRSPLQPELTVQQLPLSCHLGRGCLDLETVVPLPAPLAAAATLQLNLCAVLEAEGGELSYWALHHPGSEADFHRRDGFSLVLP